MRTDLVSATFLTLGVLAATVPALAQGPHPDSDTPETAPAPIVRAYAGAPDRGDMQAGTRMGTRTYDSAPAAGVYVRSDMQGGVQTVSAAAGGATELRVVGGRADVTLHHPADHSQILVDLPGGQVALMKDGVYTFNVSTNTVRVLHGEAEAFAGTQAAGKGAKIKDGQELAFFPNAKLHASDAYPNELGADLLPGSDGQRTYAGSGYRGAYGDGFYGGGPYGEFGYGYPYYAGLYGGPFGFGYGYPYDYGYGFGYPFGVGIGFGYYGGFGGGYGGGFRGGFGGGGGGFGGGHGFGGGRR